MKDICSTLPKQSSYKIIKWTREVKLRDKNKCQICGETAAEIHHIFSRSKFPKLSNLPNNGISLCLKHHKEAHGGNLTKKKSKTKAVDCGPLESLFPCNPARIIDFMETFSSFEFSITEISQNTGLSYKTTFDDVKNLEKLGLLRHTRNLGRKMLYTIDHSSNEGKSLHEVILEIAKQRIWYQIQKST